MDKIAEGKRVFNVEIEALRRTRDCLDEVFLDILNIITNCKGKVIVTGMGKPGHIAGKLAATFSSLGTPAFFLHPAEAMHGDLGMISREDVVMAISYSGESDEIIGILPNIKMQGATLVAITGNGNSTLAKAADYLQIFPQFEEACYLGLAPTSSTTATLVYGDALAVVASALHGFKEVDFGRVHPAGALGKKLVLTVNDIMADKEKNAVVRETVTLQDAIVELSKKGLGIVSVIDSEYKLLGVITDGDLRRALEKRVSIYELNAVDIMTTEPVHISSGELAISALQILKQRNITSMPVLEEKKVIGTIRLQDIINRGIIG
ncbi:MAG: KpsF/GutQ family sugar-phosphate isomerase [Lachnospiraceae bacterium]|nr:KpsF/GutQ family sugar-phosphate isomerase [Lachnospiraceae bacterium]